MSDILVCKLEHFKVQEINVDTRQEGVEEILRSNYPSKLCKCFPTKQADSCLGVVIKGYQAVNIRAGINNTASK